MVIEDLFVDRDWTNEQFRPETAGIFISGKRGRLFSHIYYPGGKGPFPTIIFCHGVPGNEQMVDFALALRHIGFCTVRFHYSGSWGSDGIYSVSNCMEDMDSVMEHVLSNPDSAFDLNNLFLVGHSLGGLVGAYALAKYSQLKAGALIMPANLGRHYILARESLEARDTFQAVYDGFGQWLNGFSWDSYFEDATTNWKNFLLTTYAPQLSEKPLLAVSGSVDEDVPPQDNIDVLISAICTHSDKHLKTLTVPTGHSMPTHRNTIIRALAEFFDSQL